MPGGKCVFSAAWCDKSEYKDWLAEGRDRYNANCTACKKDIDIANGGESALRSHSIGKKHQAALKAKQKTGPKTIAITEFLSRSGPSPTVEAEESGAIVSTSQFVELC